MFRSTRNSENGVKHKSIIRNKRDQNAKVGKVNTEHERAMGKKGHGVMNENGERLANMYSTNEVIGGTLKIYKQNYMELSKPQWKNQINHIIINVKLRRLLLDTRPFRGADVNSDNHLVIAKLQLKLKKVQDNNKPVRKIINVNCLKEPEIKQVCH
ncbi:unnamed protein product [Mytilus edulis]|uniref:Uncharacterized protein n=1 Tax=Mytilus edulis TaxID=6550 RepID=A0A8S3RM10_MYTED|nr:unnamed protein product [Mytilus edulis]